MCSWALPSWLYWNCFSPAVLAVKLIKKKTFFSDRCGSSSKSFGEATCFQQICFYLTGSSKWVHSGTPTRIWENRNFFSTESFWSLCGDKMFLLDWFCPQLSPTSSSQTQRNPLRIHQDKEPRSEPPSVKVLVKLSTWWTFHALLCCSGHAAGSVRTFFGRKNPRFSFMKKLSFRENWWEKLLTSGWNLSVRETSSFLCLFGSGPDIFSFSRLFHLPSPPTDPSTYSTVVRANATAALQATPLSLDPVLLAVCCRDTLAAEVNAAGDLVCWGAMGSDTDQKPDFSRIFY